MRLDFKKIVFCLSLLAALIISSCSSIPTPKRSISSVIEKNACVEQLIKIIDPNIKFESDGRILNIIKKRKFYQRFVQKLQPLIQETDFTPLKQFDASIKVLAEPKLALAAKLSLIKQAKSTIDISTFILGNDEVSGAILNELKDAVQRGVQIRILVDSVGSVNYGKNSFFQHTLKSLTEVKGGKIINELGEETSERATIEISTFNDISNISYHLSNWLVRIINIFREEKDLYPINSFHINHRLHDKLLIVDANDSKNSMAIMGGRNLANDYFGLKGHGHNFADFEIIMKTNNHNPKHRGSNLGELLQLYYDRLYFHLGNRFLKDALFQNSSKRTLKEHEKMKHSSMTLQEGLKNELKITSDKKFFKDGFHKSSTQFLHELDNLKGVSKSSKKFRKSSIITHFYKEMSQAKKRIRMIAPYLNLHSEDIEKVRQWLSEDPTRTFEIITSSPISNDTIPTHALIDQIVLPKLTKELSEFYSSGQLKIHAFGKIEDLELTKNHPYESSLRKIWRYFFQEDSHALKTLYKEKLHSKLITLDDDRAFVMSFNYNGRSRYKDSESGVLITDESKDLQLLSNINQYIDELSRNSHVWGSKEWRKIRESHELSPVVTMQEIVAFFIRVFGLEDSI